MRVGFFARADNGGLGAESWEFARHYRPDKVLIIRGEHGHFPERFSGLNCTFSDGIPSDSVLDAFLRDIDVVVSIETFYNWKTLQMAKERNIISVLRVNYEFMPQLPEHQPDYYISPINWHYENIPDPKFLLQFPVNRKVLPFANKKVCTDFYHVAGHDLYEDRNGTLLLLEALRWMKTQPRIKIYTQHDLGFDFSPYPNVELVNKDLENYWDVHTGDCLILPRRYGGQSLQMNEALSTGAMVLMPNVPPQNQFLPSEMMIESSYSRKIQCHGAVVDCYDVDPQRLAMRIDELNGADISELSDKADAYADSISWETMLPKYKSVLENL